MPTYRCPPPDIRQKRNRATLMVWGDAPHWLVADRELAEAIDTLVEPHTPRELAAKLAQRWNRPARSVRRELKAPLKSLRKGGVLGRNGRAPSPPKPRHEPIEVLCVNLTNRCNLDCTICFNDAARTRAEDELSAEEILDVVAQARPLAGKRAMLALMGGEPLLVADKLIEVARGGPRQWETLVSTNGTLVDERFAARAAEAGLVVQVSIDGATAAAHERIRGSDTFERATAGVRTLAAAGVHVIMSMVVHAANADQVPAYLDLALALGAAEARTLPLKRIGKGAGVGLEPPDLVRLLKTTVRAIDQRPERGRLLARDYLSLLATTCAHAYRRTGCGTGKQTLLLDADGTVYPCQNLCGPALAAGNVRERPLAEIFTGRLLAELRERTALAGRSPCNACPVRSWCAGGCRGEVHQATGSFDGPGIACREGREAILEMFWILAEYPELAGRERRHYV